MATQSTLRGFFVLAFGLVILASPVSVFAQSGGGGGGGGGVSVVPGHYVGETSQGYPMELEVVVLPSGPVVRSWSFLFELHCQNSGRAIMAGVGFYGFDVPIKNGRFQFGYGDAFYLLFEMDGVVIRDLAGGNVSAAWAAVDARNKRPRAELCMSSLPREEGVWWLAERDGVAAPVLSGHGPAPMTPEISISLTRDPKTGQVSMSQN